MDKIAQFIPQAQLDARLIQAANYSNSNLTPADLASQAAKMPSIQREPQLQSALIGVLFGDF